MVDPDDRIQRPPMLLQLIYQRFTAWCRFFVAALLLSAAGSVSSASVLISEFVADNDGSYLDDDGDAEDWIEVYNSGSSAEDLSGWSLTDDDSDLTKWSFPPGTTLAAGEFRVVFASGKNRRDVDQPLHTNFSLKKASIWPWCVRMASRLNMPSGLSTRRNMRACPMAMDSRQER